MSAPYDGSYWMPGLVATREAVGIARETIVFLHLAKSGGTSLGDAVLHSSEWEQIAFPYPAPQPERRSFMQRVFRSHREPWIEHANHVRNGVSYESRLFVWGGHPTFEHSHWIAQQLSQADRLVPVTTIYRPSRARIISRFRDYWNRAALAELPVRQALETQRPRLAAIATDVEVRRFQNDVDAFRRDSLNYRDSSGEINGRKWFTDVLTSPGFPFRLVDVFMSPEELKGALETGQLRVISIDNLDSEIQRMTGTALPRVRVSPPMPEQVALAIERSTDIIDRMVDRDAPFEDMFRRHLNGNT